jgi:CelD/BcsL family acetyltransferase involved in cellulose biosynthesis
VDRRSQKSDLLVAEHRSEMTLDSRDGRSEVVVLSSPSRSRQPSTGRHEGFAVTSPVRPEVWAALADADPDAVVSQSQAWRDCVCATGRYRDVSRLYEFADGRRILLPLVQRHGPPSFATCRASWPRAWGVGGPITPDGVRAHEAEAVLDDVARLGGPGVWIRFRHGVEPEWTAAARSFRIIPHSVQILDLSGGFDQVWERRFGRSVRNAVRKAETSSIDVEVGCTDELLSAFDDLHEQSIVRWAHQQHEPARLTRWRTKHVTSLETLKQVVRRFDPSGALWVAFRHGEPLAAVATLRFGAFAKAWKSAMNKELAGPVRAGDLLHRLIIEDACQKGLGYYDFGESRCGSPLERYKVKFGAQSHVAPELIIERLPFSSAVDWHRQVVKRAVRFVDH